MSCGCVERISALRERIANKGQSLESWCQNQRGKGRVDIPGKFLDRVYSAGLDGLGIKTSYSRKVEQTEVYMEMKAKDMKMVGLDLKAPSPEVLLLDYIGVSDQIRGQGVATIIYGNLVKMAGELGYEALCMSIAVSRLSHPGAVEYFREKFGAITLREIGHNERSKYWFKETANNGKETIEDDGVLDGYIVIPVGNGLEWAQRGSDSRPTA